MSVLVLTLAELSRWTGFTFFRLAARSVWLDFLLSLRGELLRPRTGASTTIIVFVKAERQLQLLSSSHLIKINVNYGFN